MAIRANRTQVRDWILLEVTNGVPPPAHESAEDAAVRAQLKKEVDEIRVKGGIVDVPPELPGEASAETTPPPEPTN